MTTARRMLVWSVAALVSLTAASTSPAAVVDVCGETFFDEVVGYGRPVLVEFHRPNCPVCKRMAPIYEDLSTELSGKVKLVRLNTMEERSLSAQFDITAVPTFLYFDNGNIMKRHVGGNSREGLLSLAGMPAQGAEARRLPEPPKTTEAPRPAGSASPASAQQAPVPPNPAPAHVPAPAPRAGVDEVCEESFFDEVIGYGRPVIVEFYTASCPVCKKMTPVVEELSADLSGRVKVVKVNTRENVRLSAQFEITNVPTFVYFECGNIMRRHVGGSSRDGLKRVLGIQQTETARP